MKRLTNVFLYLLVLLFTLNIAWAQPCEDFTGTTSTYPWQTYYASKGIAQPGPGGTADNYIQTIDASGPSYLYNTVDYNGNWISLYNDSQICFDFNYFYDGNSGQSITPKIGIFSGGSALYPTASATFTANFTVSDQSGWIQICAPIKTCDNSTLPFNNQGSWTIDGGGDCTDWQSILQNVTGIRIDIEAVVNNTSEILGFDNICIEPVPPFADCGTSPNPNILSHWQEEDVLTGLNTPGPGGNNDLYMETLDESGQSRIWNSTDFNTNWTTNHLGQQICWDYRIVDDGNTNGSSSHQPSISIYRGNPNSPLVKATFTATQSITEADGWVRYCAPITLCGDNLPQNGQGSWAFNNGGSDCSDWEDLLDNVDGVSFELEIVGNNLSERNGFDNICFEEIPAFAECDNDFNPNEFDHWQTINSTTYPDVPGPGGNTDVYLETYDGYGHSYIYNTVDFAGDWTADFIGQQLCWDYWAISSPDPVFPSITIFSGSASSPTATATFTSTIPVTQTSGWTTICAPIQLCDNGIFPSNSYGNWNMSGSCTDFENLLSNVSGIRIDIETAVNNIVEYNGFDNFCLGCDEEQEIEIVATPIGDRLYEFTINGYNSSATPITYNWDFGDGTSASTTSMPITHQYLDEGEYEVCVKIEDQRGCVVTHCTEIKVLCCDKIDASFEYEVHQGERECYIELFGTSQGTWTLNGSPISTYPYIYVFNGVYEVCHTITEETDQGICSDRYCTIIKVTDCFAAPPRLCNDSNISIQIDQTQSNQYSAVIDAQDQRQAEVQLIWDMGDGQIYRNQPEVNHIFRNNKITDKDITVYAFANDECLSKEVLSAKKLKGDTLIPCDEKCEAAFTVIYEGNCFYQFINQSSIPSGVTASYLWKFGDGNSSTAVSPLHVYDSPGTYEVCLTVTTSTGCESEFCTDVVVFGDCDEIAFLDYQLVSCNGSSFGESSFACLFCFQASGFSGDFNDPIVTYVWNYPGGSSVGSSLNWGPPNGSETFSVCVTAITQNGNQSTVCYDWSCAAPVQGNLQDLPNATTQSSQENVQELTIFPNPFRQSITTKLPVTLVDQEVRFTIMDLMGRKIKNGTIRSSIEMINLEEIPQGVYMINFWDQTNQLIQTNRIIKQ
ncbi:MAG: PKD domain-containing protein [Saprospiraceae bacterium]|nr:PKD domain-containing protein [Saprospiraceae bacterium]